ncbi:hypothetical protein JIQ42_07192 [Leishmania sp. Namibia]|uniref:hypothetical protein n=1 Tax=Leishmania sp. Namibia TaxID=2802991 RepID=UPI001B668A7B|nr:hypothetical protein JIQ42_07192 [Leishmania sp. Namibia]
MEHRPRSELTCAQARYVNTSRRVSATFPVGCDVFTSISSSGSMAMSFLRVAVPALALMMLILWIARFIVMRLEARRMQHHAAHWRTLPSYAEVQAMATALRSRRQAPSQEAAEGATPAAATEARDVMHCIICFSVADHLVELLPCGHAQFCAHCLVQIWRCSGMYRRLRCPLCRQPAELMCPVPVPGSKPSADDVLLLQKYTGGLCGTKLSILDRCVLRLRVMTHARLLPIVIGLRIVVLHVTMFTYLLLPTSLTEATDGVAQQQQAAQPGVPSSVIAAAYAGALHAFTIVVYTAATYADDFFLVAVSIILTGHLLQSALFKDLKL